jgi:cytosine permease
MAAMLPDYITKSTPNPTTNRAPWYANTAPTYAGIFLWIVFYKGLAEGTIDRAPLSICLLALAAAGLLCYGLYYYVPGMLGMKTGYPLYVVGSSTFGTAGGYLMPGLLMGLLQLGWFAVGTFISTQFILQAFGSTSGPGTPVFWAVAIAWGYTMAYIGVKGIQYVARVSTFLNFIPLLVLIVVFFQNMGGVSQHVVKTPDTFLAVTIIIQSVIGFFATAGAAGVDFGMNSRNEGDVKMGGLVGIAGAVMIAGGLPLLSVAGARALHPEIQGASYDAVIAATGGPLASGMFIIFALASIVPACFCAFIAGNSFTTMIPGVPRMSSTMAGVTLAVVLAATGVAGDLGGYFGIVGASFGPIVGAMVADYYLSGKKWAGPREGISIPGYAAWAAGFIVGILPSLPVSDTVKMYSQPAALYSFLTGLIVYTVLAKMGMESKVVPMSVVKVRAV